MRLLRFAVAAVTAFHCAVAAPATAAPRPYYAIGSSETIGFGVSGRSYARLVATRCGWRLYQRSEVGRPALLSVSRMPARSVATMYVGAYDAMFARDLLALHKPEAAVHELRRSDAAILLPRPLLLSANGRALSSRLKATALRDRVSVLVLDGTELTSLDGMHPTERGQRMIAVAVERWARARGLCHAV